MLSKASKVVQKKRNEHVSFLGCCLVFLLGKNKRRRDTKLRIRVVIFSFVCSACILSEGGFEKKRVIIFSFVCEARLREKYAKQTIMASLRLMASLRIKASHTKEKKTTFFFPSLYPFFA